MNLKAWCAAFVFTASGAAIADDDCSPGRSFQPSHGRINDLGGRRLSFPSPNRGLVHSSRSCEPIVRRPVRAPICEPRCDPRPRYDRCAPGSGIVIRGSAHDDDFSIGFRIGTSVPPYSACVASSCADSPAWFHDGRCGPGYAGWVTGYNSWSDYSYSAYRANYSNVVGYESPSDNNLRPAAAPSVITPAAPTPTTSIGWARWHLERAEAREACRAFEAHLVDFPADADAMRELGAALILDGRTRDGVAMIGHAYQTDPTLGYRPIGSVDDLGGEAAAKKIMRRVVPFAHEEKSGFAWLAVTALMQAQEKPPALVREMLSRARAAGLSTDVADILDASL